MAQLPLEIRWLRFGRWQQGKWLRAKERAQPNNSVAFRTVFCRASGLTSPQCESVKLQLSLSKSSSADQACCGLHPKHLPQTECNTQRTFYQIGYLHPPGERKVL
jgi:hypothetical protein